MAALQQISKPTRGTPPTRMETTMSKQFTTLKPGESFSAVTDVNVKANTVRVVRTAVHKSLADGERVVVDWTFDCSNTPIEEIMRRFANDLAITVRRELAAANAKDIAALAGPRTIDPMDYHVQRESKVDKAAKLVQSLTDEQLAALGLTRAS